MKKKNHFLRDKIEVELHLQSELSKAKMEIKDQTLSEVSRELHDNIGQIFSVVKMQLNHLKKIDPDKKAEFEDVIENVSKGIEEIRFISKIINREISLKNSILESIKSDLERIERLRNIKCTFTNEFENLHLILEHELILYRIFQESITNAIKHSESFEINVSIYSENENIILKIQDNGVGFQSHNNDGSGLLNMKTRAKLLGADLIVNSNKNGTIVIIKYPKKLIQK